MQNGEAKNDIIYITNEENNVTKYLLVNDFKIFKPLGEKILKKEKILALGLGKTIFLNIPDYLWNTLETSFEKINEARTKNENDP